MVKVERYGDDNGEWDAFVAGHPESSNYHQYGWRKVIERSFGHRTHYLVARDASRQICGVLPLTHMKSRLFGNFLVSLPFFNYGGLLGCGDAVNAVLLRESGQLLAETGADHLELRHLALQGDGLATRQHKVTMLLNLAGDEESQWRALDPKVRNQVRKAQKSGLVTITGHLELLDRFYDVFSRNMRDLGTPVYDRQFFREILQAFPEATRIIVVLQGERTVAAGLLTWYRQTLEVPWASSRRDYRELCPNNLLYWEALCFAIAKGCSSFDFGRSTPGEGTWRFKKQWGAQPVQLYWQYLLGPGAEVPSLNPANPKYRQAVRLWQRLPLAVTRMLGPQIVRSIP
jgi:FemAB-related protein (PEP-CTERM system-associated)